MELIAGILAGAAVMACGILIGKRMHSEPERETVQEETEAEREQREKDKNLREQWEKMLRYDGRSE